MILDDILGVLRTLESSNHICKVKGDAGNGKERGSCEEGRICFFDGTCRAPGRYIQD